MQGTIDQNSLYNLFEKSPLPMWVFDTQTLFFLEVNLAAELKYGQQKGVFSAENYRYKTLGRCDLCQ